MAISSEEAHASFKDFMRSENKEIAEGKLAVLEDTMHIDVDGFQFEVVSKLTPKQVRIAADISDDVKSYTEIANVFARFMADIAVHPSMKNTSFWLEYDNETGYLPDIVNYILDNSQRQSPVIKKFR